VWEGKTEIAVIAVIARDRKSNFHHGDNHPSMPKSGLLGAPGTETRRRSGDRTSGNRYIRGKGFMATQAQIELNVNSVVELDRAASRTPVIQVENVHKYYDLGETKVHALRGVDMTIEPGEFVAIMGSSGSGKSTFMNMLGCLDKPSSGRYVLEGTDVSSLEKKQLAAIRNRKLGFVFQGFNLLSRTTALENVELPTLYAQMEKDKRLERAKEVLQLVGLGERMDHYPSQLSGGQQQRVAIARALVNRPAILLADEPTGNLDSRTSVEIMQIFQDLNDSGLTIVLVTHEPDIAQFAKRTVVFRDGKIRHDDPVRNRPRAAEVLKTLPTIDE
jgi:putative ABC transport system ATP-binding protein